MLLDELLTVPELGLLEDELPEELFTVPDDGLLDELELLELFLLLELLELDLLFELLEELDLLLLAAYDSIGAKLTEDTSNKSVVINTIIFLDLLFMILLPS